MPDPRQIHQEFRARPADGTVNLAGYDAGSTPLVDSKSTAKDQLKSELRDRLFHAHELLFASETRQVLLVLQGLDCSGKNGTIKHVITAVNPVGVRTASFTKPTDEELEHDFLWRHRRALPERGRLGVFDRSHYEDVIVPMATRSLQPDEIAGRIADINAFERELADDGTVVVKCMLHISFDEQRERFLRRLRRDDKRWKFSPTDMDTRRQWNEFQAAYGDAIGQTCTDHAPWFIIPSDHKWYRNWAIASLLVETLESMGLAYPDPDLDLDDLRARLQPPN
ncbi:PPK2 family polyphosphate kinase [Rhabdothermincola salaria]|uniref:PPK2 family polyphosphate kinase n=1 Tax=Rhabdothermincola salaria TaxID=2903142 RepID=UPI001E4B5A7B|nr:PPK2 family polyphosphate kinase [Rhabdothermincola salaria]MCD9622848.1 polyphosphate kinase 2 family protein [Rhabdothermincola salaria]